MTYPPTSGPPNSGPFPAPETAGWYPDPIAGVGLRWWDGVRWTEHVAPLQPQGNEPNGLGAPGDLMNEAGRLMKERGGHLFTLFAVVMLPSTILFSVLSWFAIENLVLVVPRTASDEFDIIGFDASRLTMLGVAFVISMVFSTLFGVAVMRQVDTARSGAPETWSASLAAGLRRWPRAMGVSLLVGLLFFALLVAFTVIGAIVGATIPLLLLIVIPAAIAAVFYVWVRTSLAFVGASISAEPRAISRSFALTKDRFWPIAGRLVLLVLLLIGIQTVGNLASGPLTGAAGVDEGADIIAISDMFGDGLAFVTVQIISGILGALGMVFFLAGLVSLYRRLAGEESSAR